MNRHIFLTNRREPLPRWLDAFPGAEVMSLSAAKRKRICQSRAAVVWLHQDSPTVSLAESVATILKSAPGCPVVVLANVPGEAQGHQALQAGASGYVNALANADLLRQVAVVVENGGIWVGRDLKQRLLGALAPLMDDPPDDNLEALSPRERQVAEVVATGASNKEVARTLHITERTVKAHLSSIFEQLGVRDRVQLALLLNRARETLTQGKLSVRH